MSDLVERLQSHMGKADMGEVLSDCRKAADDIDRLRKALEESRETNRRLNRRVQISEAVSQSADDYLSSWVKVFSSADYPSRRFKERHFIKYILRDLRFRISKLSARAALDAIKEG